MQNLAASLRSKTGKGANRKLRSSGMIPGNCFGGGGEPQSLTLDPRVLRKMLLGPMRRNTLIGLSVDGGAETPVVVTELLVDPVTRELMHVDFLRVDLKKVRTTNIPVAATGVSPGVALGGRLQIVRRNVTVSCLPTEVPVSFEVDISELDGGDSVRISACPVPEGIKLLYKVDYVVLQVTRGRGAALAEEGEAGEATEAVAE